ncbi:MAG: hypothetical protein PVH95_01565 [Anaerolineae bacterium]|jgi:hypothetical protein
MQNYGRTSVSELLDDRIVYRNLVPADGRLPALAQIRPHVGLPEGLVPRKSEESYAHVIAYLLQQARALDRPGIPIERLIYVGDTRLNDGNAFANICRAGGWPGLAFIGSERDGLLQVEVVEQAGGALFLASRWSALQDFDLFCQERHHPADERAAVIVDLDKTALGARGRNDRVIDAARVDAVRLTVSDLLGDTFDPASFQAAYNRLNQPQFHPFTSDNQDYLAYICLVLGSGLYMLEWLAGEVQAGRITSFPQFIAGVDARATQLSPSLREIHAGIYANVQQGDPTPFKEFRYNEYLTTTARMGHMADGASVRDLLTGEIVITQEVRQIAQSWAGQGALLFGLSDKPDEASIPSQEQAARGCLPIHRLETHAVGT